MLCPVVLDLDGDGIETTDDNNGVPILYDHNGDGVKTKSGWIEADDAWLAYDLNGNGTVDNGGEMFGAYTVMPDGSYASDGFAALSQHDANGDGLITAADPVYSNLLLWQDLNQDGISQAEELSSLADFQIVSIDLNVAEDFTDLGNGNAITAVGSFTRSDQTVSTAANLDVSIDPFYREFTEDVPLTDRALAQPDVPGSGRVRDLRQASSLSEELADCIDQYVATPTREGQIDLVETLIGKWADTSDLKPLKEQAEALADQGVTLTYNLVTGGYDPGTVQYDEFLRKLGVVERFMGFTYGGPDGEALLTPLDASSGNLTVRFNMNQVANIERAYDRLKTDIYMSLLLLTRDAPFVDSLSAACEAPFEERDFSSLESMFLQGIANDDAQGLVDLMDFVNAYGPNTLREYGWNAAAFLVNQLENTADLDAVVNLASYWTGDTAASGEGYVTGSYFNDLVVGSDGNDSHYAETGDDILLGKGGSDRLYGEDGRDILAGGAGQDILYGGRGDDAYVVGIGSGQDRIMENDTTEGNVDVLYFTDVQSTDLTGLERIGSDLVLTYGSDDSVTVDGYFSSQAYQVELITFSDGVTWDEAAIKARVITTGTPENDVIYGYDDGSNMIYGLDGMDTLHGGAYMDAIVGGAGSDTLNNHDGGDWLFGAEDSDTMYGGAGDDIYLLEVGSGADFISENDSTEGNTDVIVFGDVKSTELRAFERQGNDLVLAYGETDQVTVVSYFGSDASKVELISFSDEVTWDEAWIKALVITAGTSEGDYIQGYDDGCNRIYCYDGDDTAYGGSQWDLVVGGAGTDRLHGGDDGDWLYGEAGNDFLFGDDGGDWMIGGVDEDRMYGGLGNDWYGFYKGSGNDYIHENDSTEGNVDVVHFYDVQSSEVTALERVGNDLVLRYGEGDQVTVVNHFLGEAYQIELIEFSDGITWDQSAITASVITLGTAGVDYITGYNDNGNTIFCFEGNDTAYGGALSDRLYGGGGMDRLYGRAGSDILFGGDADDRLYGEDDDDILSGDAGRDLLYGGKGNDTYVLGTGAGEDRIDENDSTAGNTDVVKFTDVQSTDVSALERVGYDLVVTYGEGDELTVVHYFQSEARQVEELQFSDGVTWDVAAVMNSAITIGTPGADYITGYEGVTNRIFGFDGNDTLNGASQSDELNGGAGADRLYGKAGSDILFGGDADDRLYGEDDDDILSGDAGRDLLYGGKGNDTYVLGTGAGEDRIDENDSTAGNTDVVKFTDVQSTDVSALERVGYDLVVTYGEGDELTVVHYFQSEARQVEELQFSDGVTWDVAAVKNSAITVGTSGADYITGYEGGTNRIFGLEGNDTLNGISESDELNGGAGADRLYGKAGSDKLFGGDGADSIYGDDGDDILDGGADNDTLSGGKGNDTYVLRNGSGSDRINENDATEGNTDVLEFGPGLSPEQIWLSRNGNDLVASIIGTEDKMTIGNWYNGPNYQVEEFRMSSGQALLNSKVDLLVQAMAAFAPPAAGQTSLPDDYLTSLQPVIAANWS